MDEHTARRNKRTKTMLIKAIVNREAIEATFGGRGGIDKDLAFAIANSIQGRPAEGTYSDGGEWDWRYRVWREGQETVAVDSVRSEDSRLWWLETDDAAVIVAATAGAERCLASWRRHCNIHDGERPSLDPLDVGFDPRLHPKL